MIKFFPAVCYIPTRNLVRAFSSDTLYAAARDPFELYVSESYWLVPLSYGDFE